MQPRPRSCVVEFVIATCGNYGRAMAMACGAIGMPCTVVLPTGWSDGGTFMRAAGANVHLIDGSYEDAVDESRRLATLDGAIDGNVDGPYVDAVFTGHGTVAHALHAELDEPPAALWIPVGNGTTVIAVHKALSQLGWDVPLHGVGSAGNNPLVTSWPGPYRMLDPDGVTTTDHNQPLVNWHALQGPEALDAIRASGGAVHAATDDELLTARHLLAEYGAQPTAAPASLPTPAPTLLFARARTTGADERVFLCKLGVLALITGAGPPSPCVRSR
ncbi:pyridoxal-phosphate dependent enzyme [Micromonospora sp. PSH03]|uniref:pyridoxal-phosphate dependent enzyme n=1 Tax=Micromonospora salmantinae TaxID=2911211 RepID=UPI001EE98596|nr:pyridoxal-phosphate dependent enzyme [Micromonospora salmantinae]MCG5454733.1 pyridoxal-phosphate dependent enzyme [Micromonospora salmantinae]